MLNPIKISLMFLTFSLLVLLPKVSYAWEDQHGHDRGDARHGHSFHAHANPDLTLVTGMDTIDNRVLIASDPDQTPELIDPSVPEIAAAVPVQTSGSDMDTFIVNVPNTAGGYTPVLIKQWGNAYLGPQGELYYPFPGIAQLKAMYGI